MGSYMDNLITRKIEEIQQGNNVYQVGRVTSVKERVKIGAYAKSYVSAIRRSSAVVAVTEGLEHIFPGDEVVACGETFDALYSPDSVGHMIDIFGHDRLANASFDRVSPILIERPTIPIMDRRAVKRPLETGIAGIDLI